MEFFHDPDSTIYFGWLTKGQLYSVMMVLGAIVIAWKKKLFFLTTDEHGINKDRCNE